MDVIFLAIDGRQQGPYTAAYLRDLMGRGEISRETPAWHAGMADWIPLAQMLGSTMPSLATLAASVDGFSFTNDELRAIARNQNLLMWSLLTGIASLILLHAVPVVGVFVWLGAVIFQNVALYKLGRALRLTAPWLYCIGLLVPYLGLIILLIVSGKATRVLRAYGVRVGLMGGKASDIEA